jgi:predicted anti-sigma-YlaC factor YlaD
MTEGCVSKGRAAGIVLLAVAGLALMLSGCSIKKVAVNVAGKALADSGSTFASDDDPELVAAAVPFALKTLEALLAESPRHKGLLLAACSGFTQYAYAFVQQPADYIEDQDLARATEMRARAKKLYLRAVGYGMRDLEIQFPGFADRLRANQDEALAKTTKKQVPLLYYTAGAWAAAFALDVADSQLSVNQTLIEKMMARALALDESWELGTVHDFFISWEAAHESAGGSIEKAKEHYRRARELSSGKRLSPLLAYAEAVLIREQKKAEFEALLNEALQFDVEKAPPEEKLANVLSQRRAKWLLSRVDVLF